MSIDRGSLIDLLVRDMQIVSGTEEDLADRILALDMESGAPATVHGPPQNVRDALTQLLAEEMMFGSDGSDGGYLRRVADRILALLRPVEDGTPAATCDDLGARLANIAALRDEMRTAGGAVVWIDDLDTILDGAHPGAALTPEEAEIVAGALGSQVYHFPMTVSDQERRRKLLARLRAVP